MPDQRSRGHVTNNDAQIDRNLTRLYVLYRTSLGDCSALGARQIRLQTANASVMGMMNGSAAFNVTK